MSYTSSFILSLTPSLASKVFSGDEKNVRKIFHKLATQWHPDVCKEANASEVFTQLVVLRDAALEKLQHASNTSSQSSSFSAPKKQKAMTLKSGGKIGLNYVSLHEIDAGEVIISDHAVTYAFDSGSSFLATKEMDAIESFKFADQKMRDYMSQFLPSIARKMELDGNKYAISYKRLGDEILLLDLMNHYKSKGEDIPSEHAAWMCSGLFNIAAWMKVNNIIHGAISPEMIMVSPEQHRIRLVGGWGFSTPNGKRPEVLPNRTIDLLPRLAVAGTVVDGKIDSELIRLTIREVLGDGSGTKLIRNKNIPEPITSWLLMPAQDDAIKEYAEWHKVLEKAWGKRKFVHMNIKPSDIY